VKTQHLEHHAPRAPARVLAATATAGAVAAALMIIAAMSTAPPGDRAGDRADAVSATDMTGRTVMLEPGATPAVASTADAVDSAGARLVVPAAGLDVPLAAMSTAGGEITPPGFTSAYVVRDLGTTLAAPSGGTLFVAMHALRGGGRGPGNHLQDIATGKATVEPGDRVTVGNVTYAVTGATTVGKTAIAADAGVWANTPDRLVLITCLEKPDGSPSTSVLVIEARRSER
jgi:hypothetical protein